MARPKLGEGDTQRLQLKISDEELTAIEDWRFANRVSSRSEAVRRLVQIGMQADSFADLHGEQVMELAKWAADERATNGDADVIVPANKFGEMTHVIVSLLLLLSRSAHFAKTPHFEHLLEKEREGMERTLAALNRAAEGDES